jgi:sarcosine oxidase
MRRTDVVVVGGGAMGSAAAWQLSRRGREVVLVEQFHPGHERGSSHGSSRIVRLAYSDPFYVELAARAYDAWVELEDATGQRLITWTGVADHGDRPTVDKLADALTGGRHDIELIDPAEATQRWPGLRFDGQVLFHPRGGQVHADRTVQAMQADAARLGAEVVYGTRVTAIVPTADGVEVHTDGDAFAASQVVVAAGAWSAGLLGSGMALPALTVTREQPVHFQPIDGTTPWPSSIHHQSDAVTRTGTSPRGTYLLGSPDGVKVGFHAVGPVVETADPGDLRGIDEAAFVAVREYVTTWVPGVDPASGEPAPCLYTLTDNSDFVIDRVGNVTVAAGFSGHGFKFTPLIGQLLADLVTGERTPPERFRLAR